MERFTSPGRARSPSTGHARPRHSSMTAADQLAKKVGAQSPQAAKSATDSPADSDSEENYKQVHDAQVMSAVLMDQHAELVSQYDDLMKINEELRVRIVGLESSRAEHDRLSTQVSLLEAQLRGAQQSQSLLEIDVASKNRVIEELKQQISSSSSGGSAKEFAALLEQREQYASWLEGAKNMIEKMRTQIDGLQAQNKTLLDEAKFNQQQADEVPKLKSEIVELKRNNKHLKDKLELLSDGSPRSSRRGSEPPKLVGSLSQRLEPLVRAVGVSVANDIALLQAAVAEIAKFEETLRTSETANTPVKLSVVLLDYIKSHLLATSNVDDSSLLPLTLVVSQKLIQVSSLLEKANAEIKFLQETEQETKEELNRKNAAKVQHHINMYNTLAKEMEALTQELNDLKSKAATTESTAQQASASSDRVNELEQKLRDADADRESLMKQLSESIAEKESLGRDAEGLRAQLNETSEAHSVEISSLKKRLLDQSEQLESLQSTNSADAQRFSHLEAELSQLKEQTNGLEKEREHLLSQNSTLESQLRDAHARTTELEGMLSKEREQMQQLQANFASAVANDTEEKAKLTADLDEARNLQQSHESQIASLKEQLKQLSAYNDTSVAELKKVLASRDSEIDELQTAKAAMEDGNRILKEQLTQYMDNVESLKGELAEAKTKYDQLLASQSSEHESSVQLKSELEAREKESARMRELLEHKDEQNESQGKLIESLNRQIHEMADLDAARDQQMKSLNDELLRTRNNLVDLQNRFASEVGELTAKTTNFSSQMSSLESQLDASSKKAQEEGARAAIAEEARLSSPNPSTLMARPGIWKSSDAVASPTRSLTELGDAASNASTVPTPSLSRLGPVAAGPDAAAGLASDPNQPPPSILSSSWWSQIFT